MAPSHFDVIEHTVVSSYVREYPLATTKGQEDKLQLHVKQYVPRQRPEATTPNIAQALPAVTIIACGALGPPKEIYEPLWEELHGQLQAQGMAISSIWIADPVHQGLSSVLNAGRIGDDPSWIDHSRDLFLIVNQFRDQMPRPLVGIGHSFGAIHLANLAFFHPRLLSSVVFLDPFITKHHPQSFREHPVFHKYVVNRPSSWPSRAAAEASIPKSPLYSGWDPRCLQRLLKHGLVPVPTREPPTVDSPVTLTTPVAQEIHAMGRRTFSQTPPDGTPTFDRDTTPDLDPLDAEDVLYRWEMRSTWDRLPELRPPAKFVLASRTYVLLDEVREGIQRCGTARSGSGGVTSGRVSEVTIKGAGHFFPMELVERAARECASWIAPEMLKWRQAEVGWREELDRRAKNGEQVGAEISPWMKDILRSFAAKIPRAKI
ncbi:host-specific AK-toxin Akt2 [Aspergillus ellipticus CBS 707.79]|uniref:Host-specific AK-toxin Akt2 n=1 Tax=Aspergillus ellipticus CBS 707.79 TaxID=1448320 RepID=A0A319D4Z4_9EURO|nr:host-specific AK-toxin Akt2 [Aspergillus ellipticus CBS 707.79]